MQVVFKKNSKIIHHTILKIKIDSSINWHLKNYTCWIKCN